MHIDDWIELISKIPPEFQDILTIVTHVGTEVSVQAILRMEKDYMVLRGRLAGTTDTGRIFFIPYDHLDHLGFNKDVSDAQMRRIYGEPEPDPSVKVAKIAKREEEKPAEQSAPVETNAPELPKTPEKLSKETLLGRLRARFQPGGDPPGP